VNNDKINLSRISRQNVDPVTFGFLILITWRWSHYLINQLINQLIKIHMFMTIIHGNW